MYLTYSILTVLFIFKMLIYLVVEELQMQSFDMVNIFKERISVSSGFGSYFHLTKQARLSCTSSYDCFSGMPQLLSTNE